MPIIETIQAACVSMASVTNVYSKSMLTNLKINPTSKSETNELKFHSGFGIEYITIWFQWVSVVMHGYQIFILLQKGEHFTTCGCFRVSLGILWQDQTTT